MLGVQFIDCPPVTGLPWNLPLVPVGKETVIFLVVELYAIV